MIRLLPFFLLEGIKSLKEEIKKSDDKKEIIHKVRSLLNSLENINDLFELSYTFSLTRNNNKYDFQSPINIIYQK